MRRRNPQLAELFLKHLHEGIETMVDNPLLRGEPDRSRIALQEEHEVRYWTHKWGISEDELTEAVNAVGHNSAAVARHLGRSEYN